jgi:hypothetical protein
MNDDERGRLDGSNGDLAEYPAEYIEHVASHEFEKARIRSILRRLAPRAGVVGDMPSGCSEDPPPSRSIPAASVAGVIAEGRLLPLPILPRGLKESWMRSFYRLGEDDYGPLGAVRRGELWYLEDEPGALLAFEILRSRGASSLRIQPARLPAAKEDFSLLSIPSLASASGAVLGCRPAK